MDNHKSKLQPLSVMSMEVIRQRIQDDGRLTEATRRDYLAQIRRCITIYNANSLIDISADITAFIVRFKKSDFPFENFKTPGAYRSWRNKMISILRRALGVTAASQERHSRNDAWNAILTEWPAIAPANGKGIIAISLLADQARIANLEPHEINRDWLVGLTDDLGTDRRGAIARAIRLLGAARAESQIIDRLLGSSAGRAVSR